MSRWLQYRYKIIAVNTDKRSKYESSPIQYTGENVLNHMQKYVDHRGEKLEKQLNHIKWKLFVLVYESAYITATLVGPCDTSSSQFH